MGSLESLEPYPLANGHSNTPVKPIKPCAAIGALDVSQDVRKHSGPRLFVLEAVLKKLLRTG